MVLSAWWRVNWRIILQLSLFAVCCVIAVWVRALVASESLSDLVSVMLQIGTVLAFVGAAAMALPAGRHARNLIERVALRTVPVGVLIVAGMFVKTSYADVSVALNALTAKTDNSSTVLALGPGGRDVRLSGSITEGAARELAGLLDAHPTVERIHLTSDGGLADEGDALRKVIAGHKLTTFVPDYCVSACTLAFLGGRERFMMDDARLGFHAPYEQGLFDQTFAGDAAPERASYLASGVAADFVDQAFRVKPEDIWTPSAEKLISAHVVTGVVDRYRFPDSNLDGVATKAGARATVLSNFPLARTLESAKPRAVDVIATWYLDAYQRGLSEGEIVDEVTAILQSAASSVMAKADDETLVSLGRYIETAMESADTEEVCASIGAKASLIEAENALSDGGDSDGDAETRAAALLSRALQTRRLLPPKPQRHDPLWAMTAGASSAGPPCARMRAIYADALRRSPHDAAAAIRTLVVQPAETPVSAEVDGVLAH